MQSVQLIGIAGGSGAGKTALAGALAEALESAAIVRTDWYYRDLSHLPPEERAKTNFDHPDALEWDLLREQLAYLREGRDIERPVYDYALHVRGGQLRAEAAQTVILEGLFALAAPEIRELLDVAVFVQANEQVRLGRRMSRDIEQRGRTQASVEEQFHATVAPMHREHVEPQARYADLVVDGEAPLAATVAHILTRARNASDGSKR